MTSKAATAESRRESGEVPASTRQKWDRIAVGYDRTNTRTQMRVASEGLGLAGIRAGMTFLDVASGSGALSIPAARLGARVTAVDQSPVMLKLLEERAVNERLTIDARVMDGHALLFDDDTFDATGSQFGVMLFPDVSLGIRQMARVTRPGGKAVVLAYGDPEQIDFLHFITSAIRSVRPDFDGPPSDPPPLEFQLADPERMRNELTAAGLKDVRVETVTETTEYETGTDLWEWLVWSNPLVETILGDMLQLTGDERKEVETTLERLVRERAGNRPAAELRNPVNIGIGTRP